VRQVKRHGHPGNRAVTPDTVNKESTLDKSGIALGTSVEVN
jgi:hypothetical protein